MEDPQEKLGTLAKAAILAQEKINTLKKKIELLKTGSAKTDLEIELSSLEDEQSRRMSTIERFRQSISSSSRRPCFVRA
ncbi:MAG: hypothetical protein KAI72_08630 [Candidatus Pacebacteria bacterium]|nr:hypothetical protein [Candidatus Paceibacterota bacterium]